MFRCSGLRAPALHLTPHLKANKVFTTQCAVPRSPFPNYNGPRMHFVLLSIQLPYTAFWLNWPSIILIKSLLLRKQSKSLSQCLFRSGSFSSYEIEKGNLMFSSKNWNFFHFNFLHQGLCQSIICHRFSILGSLMLEESSATLHRWKSELSSAIENMNFPPSAINIATVSTSIY